MHFAEPVNKHAQRVASILKRFALLPRSFGLTCAESVGLLPSGVRLVYLGDGESLQYLMKSFEIDEFRRYREKIPFRRAGKMIKSIIASGALLCVELNRLLDPLMKGEGLLTFPWLRQRVYLDSREYRGKRRRIEETYGRKVRKYRYGFRLVNDVRSVERFHEEFYLPHVTGRYGAACHSRSLDELKGVLRKGFLLQVLCDNVWISGVVCAARKERLTAVAFGHLPEERHPLRLGGLSAAYYHLFDYAARHSFDCVDLLRSRPDAHDGVYCHKQRWGAVAEMDSWPHTAIRLFPPAEMPLPQSFKRMLVWSGGTFEEAGQVMDR
jgi:hypothetical protein